MRTIRIPKNADLTYLIERSNTLYIVNKGVTLDGDLIGAIEESETSRSNTLRVDGYVDGIDLWGTGTTLLVGARGEVRGVDILGNDQTVINDGTMRGTVSLADAENLHKFENSGRIDGSIYLGQSTFQLVLGKESELMNKASFGISRDAGEGVVTRTINNGLIEADTAFRSGDADDTIINKGVLRGDVWLGAGNDMFKDAKASGYWEIHGGDGDDTYIFLKDSLGSVIEEVGGGNDTIKGVDIFLHRDSEVETLILIGQGNFSALGSKFANQIFGNAGNNLLRGGAGGDTLEGGAGADRFELAIEGGNDVVTDFDASEDIVYMVSWDGRFDVDDVLEFSSEVDGGVLIAIEDDSIFLAGAALEDLTWRNFYF